LVFAVWVGCTPQVLDPSIALALEASRDRGLLQLEAILASKENNGIALPLGREQVLDYYRRAIVYTLGEEEQSGLQRLFEL
jgi:predicted solute-binding protein